MLNVSTVTSLIHEFRCPLDYCKDTAENVMLSHPSTQCDFNRNGTLCGKCQRNFTLALGSLHCIPCNNNHVALIVIIFCMAGIVLITVVFLLRLTVAVETLNDLMVFMQT